MKELFKIEPIRQKIPDHFRPKKHQINAFFIGKTDALNERQIKCMISIVESGSKSAIAFLNNQLKKLHNEQAKSRG
jgi:hypothetical protein